MLTCYGITYVNMLCIRYELTCLYWLLSVFTFCVHMAAICMTSIALSNLKNNVLYFSKMSIGVIEHLVKNCLMNMFISGLYLSIDMGTFFNLIVKHQYIPFVNNFRY